MTDKLENCQLPPNSPEAERGLLACCILGEADVVPMVEQRIKELEVWYDVRHIVVWRAILAIHTEQKVPLSSITLMQRLKDTGRIEDAGGVGYVADLPEASPSSSMWTVFAATVMQT